MVKNSSANFMAFKKIAMIVSKMKVKKRVFRADRKVMPSGVCFMSVTGGAEKPHPWLKFDEIEKIRSNGRAPTVEGRAPVLSIRY